MARVRPAPVTEADSAHTARVVASYGRHVLLQTETGRQLIGHPRGKKNQAVVGDRVLWQSTGDEASIESVLPRRNLFYRQDEIRTKSFAANLDQVLILIAAEPEFSAMQLTRALVAAEAGQIRALIALNKRDLAEPFERAWARLAPYRHMGYSVLPLSLKPQVQGLDELQAQLHGRVTLVLGPSGSGKSSLINRLVPAAQADTAEISQALNSGKHTTTHTRWYALPEDAQTVVIDSPGFQEFGLRHLEATQLAACMPDFRVHLGHCRFYNCTHLHEPGCAVLSHVQAPEGSEGAVSPHRHQLYAQLFAELSQPRW